MNAGIQDQVILVTGGGGFIGSHLVDALAEENTVRVLDNFTSGSQSNVHANTTVLEGDIRDESTVAEAMRDVDTVFHHAAMVSVTQSVEMPTLSHAIKASATVSILDRARLENSRVVLASSAAIYGPPNRCRSPKRTRKLPYRRTDWIS